MSPVPTISRAGGPATVLGRIAEIESRFQPSRTSPPESGTAFERVLGDAIEQLIFSQATQGLDTPIGSVGVGAAADGDGIVQTAMDYLGVPYVWGGTDPSVGLDCSGLVQLVLRRHGIDAPRVAADQARIGTPVASLADARPGDLIAFGNPVNHIGIYVGDGCMLHAPRSGRVVSIDPIGSRNITAIRRVAPSPAGDATLGASAPLGPSTLPPSIIPQVRRFEPLFVAAGQRWGIPPAVLAAQAQLESAGNTQAVSSAGAQGLMQFMPATAAAWGVNPWDPASAIDGAARFLASLRRDFGGSLELALAAYNAGPGAVRRAGNQIPYAETRAYIQRLSQLIGGIP